MAALAAHKPRLATVLDLERPDQLEEVLSWAEEATQHVSEAVIVIPKYSGAIAELPRAIRGTPVRLGYSVPTKFAGTAVPIWEFQGWPVHLLGGAPHTQHALWLYMDVVSVDCNYHLKMATQWNQFFANGGHERRAKNRYFPQLQESVYGHINDDAPYLAFELSCMNIRALWLGCKAHIRYAVEEDLSVIKRVANQWKDELGFVNRAAVLEGIKRREVQVATVRGYVVGFVHWHRRRDGWATIYEIAVRRDWLEQRIGAALLVSIPRPRQLKCPVDNVRANDFYAKSMTWIKTQPGRKRELHLWQTP
jgi:hypothetical protein